jgi:hypothetical protein
MQVKNATFQRTESGGKAANRSDVSGAGQSAPPKCILYFNGKYIKKSQRLTVRATTDLFLMTLQCAVM